MKCASSSSSSSLDKVVDDDGLIQQQQPPPPSSQQHQLLVRFQNRTYVLNCDDDEDDDNNRVTAAPDRDDDDTSGVLLTGPSLSCRSQHTDDDHHIILDRISQLSGYPRHYLHLTSYAVPFVTVAVTGHIRGGKGGFGTLLKGQSRQAGARSTTDWSACRDLQGRRLRHVNDALNYRVWREWRDKVEAGTATEEEMVKALKTTPSGIQGWQLQLPGWADVSKSHKRQIERQYRNWKREQKAKQDHARQKKQWQESVVQSYVQQADTATAQVSSRLQDALQQGLQAQQQQQEEEEEERRRDNEQQQQRQEEVEDDDEESEPEDHTATSNKRQKKQPDPPVAVMTLAGDAFLEYHDADDAVQQKKGDHSCSNNNGSHGSGGRWRLRSLSNFCTVAMMLQETMTTTKDDEAKTKLMTLYYEIVVVTGGLVQMGWAMKKKNIDEPKKKSTAAAAPAPAAASSSNSTARDDDDDAFRPRSESGDGVGDDGGSWAYDGSRGIQLHAGETKPYGNSGATLWKAGDVVGCRYKPSTGEIWYTLNGTAVGGMIDYTVPIDNEGVIVFPAVSCNEGEIVELRWNRADMDHCPKTVDGDDVGVVVPVGDFFTTDEDAIAALQFAMPETNNDTATAAATTTGAATKAAATADDAPAKKPAAVIPEKLDLAPYNTSEELETLGLDRLKSALMAIGVKCGGTLQERAGRLFSLKGLAPADYPPKLLAKKAKKQRW